MSSDNPDVAKGEEAEKDLLKEANTLKPLHKEILKYAAGQKDEGKDYITIHGLSDALDVDTEKLGGAIRHLTKEHNAFSIDSYLGKLPAKIVIKQKALDLWQVIEDEEKRIEKEKKPKPWTNPRAWFESKALGQWIAAIVVVLGIITTAILNFDNLKAIVSGWFGSEGTTAPQVSPASDVDTPPTLPDETQP